MSLSPQWLDELRSRITLSSVIQRTTRLTKAGREFKACCPFHNEKSPSFYVNDEKGFYHCFGCGVHGDAIRWMTDQRGLGFMDAVKELAAEAGLDVPAPDPRAAEAAVQRDSLHDVTAAAQKWFMDCLAAPEGEKARAYLATRGFDAHTVQRFGFGFAPEGRQALKGALGQFPEDKLIEAGLRITVDDKEPYDRFRGRLMLPIEDARGRVIAFGGRILDKSKTDAPKYLNSPDTPLFDKGRTLYNLHRAGPASRQTGRLIVVEGYMDVIALAAAGFGESVAPLGTALTERQIEMVWRLVETPILCFDGDAAGQRAAMRAIARALPLLRPAHSLRIVRLPSGLDPDDLIKRDGPRAMEEVLQGARSLIDTLWDHERDALPLNTPEDKAGLKARLLAHVETIADPDIKSLYRRELLDRFAAFAYPAREQRPQSNWQPGGSSRGSGNWKDKRRAFPANPANNHSARLLRVANGGARDALSAAILTGLIRYPAEIARHADALARCTDIEARFDLLLDACDHGQALESDALATILARQGQTLPSPSDYSGMRFGFLSPDMAAPQACAELAQAIELLVERPALETALADATERLNREFTDEAYAEQQRLLKRKLEFNARLGQMASARAALSSDDATNTMAE
ncbi:DNA primase [Novosphingobium sp. G106]|uniref:DNA primase n=1 Tax=Novosphingobium sp. G106 TaxID=2849500 RepID=UPI001C2D6AF9|nr:DNA primase [Novosphingobium sp. G106]MBV1687392.1 DNA primase [Novosphingobium sp. G106]